MRSTGPSTPSATRGQGFSHARIGIALTLMAASALASAACAPAGSGSTPVPTAVSTTAVTPAPTVRPTSTPTLEPEFPTALVDDEGTSVEIAAEPQSVVSLTPANTEIVFALGAGDRLTGGTDFDDYPPEAVDLPDVATFTGVLIEKVVDIDPDLVLAGGNNFTPAGDIERLRQLGIPVLVIYAETVDEVLADIRLIGTATGFDQEAADIVAGMESRIDEVTDAVSGLDRPRVFYELGIEPEIFGPAPNSFVADMVNLAGGEPITTTDPAVFSISLERLIDQDPEVIVLGDAAYGVCPQQLAVRPGWAAMTAVRDGHVRPVDDIVVTRPGPRLAEGLAALALAIHPDLDIAPPEDVATYCVSPD